MDVTPTLLNTLSSKNIRTAMSLEDFFNTVAKPSGYSFFEWEDSVYQVTEDAAPKYTGFDFQSLTVDEPAVLQYAVSIGHWDGVNSLMSDIRSQVEDRLGKDYSRPHYDE